MIPKAHASWMAVRASGAVCLKEETQMITAHRKTVPCIAALLWMACAPPDPQLPGTPPAYANARVTALTTGNTMIRFYSGTPGSVGDQVPISGLQPGETLHGITFRPATGGLYGLGSSSRLYLIDPATGAVAPVGTPFATPLSGSVFGFDFNPTVDRIRVVSDTGQNLRLHPDTGAVAGVDMPISPPAAAISAVGYTNSAMGAPVGPTTLYNIDVTGNYLVLQGGINGTPSPNTGVLAGVGPLGVDASGVAGFDILYVNGANIAFAALTVGGASSFYSVSLETGAATRVGSMAGGLTIKSIALLP
jgi:hypothetical protein